MKSQKIARLFKKRLIKIQANNAAPFYRKIREESFAKSYFTKFQLNKNSGLGMLICAFAKPLEMIVHQLE